MRIIRDTKLDFEDVLIRPKRSTLTSRSEVSLERTYKFVHGAKSWTGVPVIASNMDGVGTLSMMKTLSSQKLLTALTKHTAPESNENLEPEYTFITVGTKDDDYNYLQKFAKKSAPRFVCIDVANGYTERMVAFVARVRKLLPETVIMAGNVVTGEMTEQLILSGADIVKVGIGPGSVCTTRKVTGVGYPQLSAIIDCADAAHGLNGLVCADGGCSEPGDVAKAFGAGADFVMLGSMLAGHDESEMEFVEKDGQKFISYYGSSSKAAMEKHAGGVAGYRASEGKDVLLPYKGPVENSLQEILGGLRSACTYVGAPKLREFSKRTTFLLVSHQRNLSLDKFENKS